MYEDKTLVCKDCGKEFIFSAGEQEFYARKNSARGNKEMFEIVCANCGKVDKVPFEPRHDRPVYCSECFASMSENN